MQIFPLVFLFYDSHSESMPFFFDLCLHRVCVGIVVPPKEEESWFCNRCIAKRQGALAKKKKKKHRKEK